MLTPYLWEPIQLCTVEKTNSRPSDRGNVEIPETRIPLYPSRAVTDGTLVTRKGPGSGGASAFDYYRQQNRSGNKWAENWVQV